MLTIPEVASALDGQLTGEPEEQPITSVVVDSRQVTPGSLFVALKGQKHDGHDFILDAFVRGARAALVEKVPAIAEGRLMTRPLPMVQVGDTLAGLQRLASYWRRKQDFTVVGVTGSVGKTTTKEVVASVLSRRFRVHRSEGNLNTDIGLPLTLLQASPRHRVVVVEMGMYALGEIRALATLSEPNIGVVTNVGPTHLERLGSMERIAEGKGELVEELSESGVAVLNFDDPRVRPMSARTRAKVVYYGLDPAADFWADRLVSRGLKGIQFDLQHENRRLHVRMPLLGLHSIHAALAASAVAKQLGLSLEEIAEGLHEVSNSLRLIVAAGINGSTIIDDSYNASPASTLAGLNLLAEMDGRKVAVLGDMRELGDYTEDGHRMVGRRAADVAQILVAVGPLGSMIGEEALKVGKKPETVLLARTNQEAIDRLRETLRPGDCVLIKGSRGMQLEEVVEAIRCHTP
jgi:UDP-N-acetylmuramoyl-tripeptide--D-alanyl-D-alanine ligase